MSIQWERVFWYAVIKIGLAVFLFAMICLLFGCQSMPVVETPLVGSSVVTSESAPAVTQPVEDITILPTSEVTVNPSKPVTMTSVTVPEPDPAPYEWGNRQTWVRNPDRVYPRLIQGRNESDNDWIARMEERSKPRPSR